MKVICLIFCLAVTCCGKEKQKAKPTEDPLDVILKKRDVYVSLISEVQDDFGFVFHTCDSLLFTSLVYSTGLSDLGSTAEIDLFAARDEDTGQWFRTPYHDCYRGSDDSTSPARKSGSEISGDMLVGLIWALTSQGHNAALRRLWDYGRDNNWIMGSGGLDRTYFIPNFQYILYSIIGKKYAGIPPIWVDPIKDHQRHIWALAIGIYGYKHGEIEEAMLNLIKKFVKKDPESALFQFIYHRYTDGDQSESIKLLLDNRLFPINRLPTERDRRTAWLWERDSANGGREPGDGDKIHTGGDLIFVAWLLDESR